MIELLEKELQAIYKTGAADKNYKNQLYSIVNPLREKYSLSGSYMKPMRERLNSAKES